VPSDLDDSVILGPCLIDDYAHVSFFFLLEERDDFVYFDDILILVAVFTVEVIIDLIANRFKTNIELALFRRTKILMFLRLLKLLSRRGILTHIFFGFINKISS